MAVVYFTSNASTGAGSLVEAIKNASPGDVVRPDETVFERGSTIEIVLAATLTLDKNLTLDGGPFRVRLNADGRTRCVALAENANVEMTAFDVVGGGWNSQTNADVGNAAGAGLYVPGGSKIALNRCGFFACRGTYGGAIAVGTGAAATLNDCVIAGCYARGSGAGIRSVGNVSVYGSTIMGNVEVSPGTSGDILVDGSGAGRVTIVNSIVGKYRGNVEIGDGCVVGVASSQIGFVASPPDDLSVETWDANAWRNWDLRLLDDASPNPSPYRDAGDVDAASKYDYQGNFRGRESEGVATCSPGAYETIQADLFWVGRDATGAEVVSPSFLTSNGWAASRFATVSGYVAPQNGDVVFIDGSIAFDGNSLRLKKLVVGGGASLSVDNSSGATLTTISDQFDFGVGSTLRSVGSSTLRFQIGRAVLVSRFGDWVNIQPQFLLGDAAGLEIAPTAKFTTVASSVKLYANGFYTNYNLQITNVATVEGDSSGCKNVYVSFQKPTARIAANGTPRVACGLVKWTTPSDATSGFTALETGSAPIVFAPRRSATVAGNGSRDDFLIDVSNAQTSGTLALTLTGQTVCGDAPTCAVALTGSARVDERGLTSQTLTLNADAELNVDGGFVCVGELDAADGASVAFLSERGDAVLTATESATVGAASFSGVGYFATPPETDLTAATFAETIRRVDYSAGVETFAATATGPTTARLEWSATDATARVCVERENAAAPNGWETLALTPTEDASPLSVALSGRERFRIFDGQTFYVDAAWSSMFGQQFVVLSSYFRVANEKRTWEAKTKVISNTLNVKAGQSVTILARISDAFDAEALLLNDGTNIISVSYSALKKTGSLSSNETPIDGHVNVAVPTTCVLEAPLTSDAWGEKYNFILTPNIREKPIFPTTGNYSIKIEIVLADGNPITFYVEIEVS